MFKLVGNGETPVLSLSLTESNNDTRDCSQASERESLSTEFSSKDEYIPGESSEDDCSSMESLMETGKKKCSPKRRVTSYSSYYKRYVTFTLPHGYATHHHTLVSSSKKKNSGFCPLLVFDVCLFVLCSLFQRYS